jgi:hypothetical protein
MVCRDHGIEKRCSILPENIRNGIANVSLIDAGYVDDVIAGSEKTPGKTTPVLFRKYDEEKRMVLEALKQGRTLADIRKCKTFVKEFTLCRMI